MLNDDIIRLIEQGSSDQQALLAKLADLGYDLTQSSISRKLKQLGIIKLQGKYQLPRLTIGGNKIKSIAVIAPNLLVIRTAPGHADMTASIIDEQLIENQQYPEFVGSIAGDDTIFLAINLGNKDSTWAIDQLKQVVG
jgi:transcriptional regulator of arginine metabolism